MWSRPGVMSNQDAVWYDGCELSYKRFLGQQDFACYVFGVDDKEFCFQTGRFGFGGRPKQIISIGLLFKPLSSICWNCKAMRTDYKDKTYNNTHGIQIQVVGHLTQHRNFVRSDKLIPDHRIPPSNEAAESSRFHSVIYTLTKEHMLKAVGYALHLHIASGAALHELQYKRSMYGVKEIPIAAAIAGVYFGEDKTLDTISYVDSPHTVHATSKVVLVKFRSSQSDYATRHKFAVDAGLITSDKVERTLLDAQTSEQAHMSYDALASNRLPTQTPDVMGVQEQHFITCDISEIKSNRAKYYHLQVDAFYMWVRI